MTLYKMHNGPAIIAPMLPNSAQPVRSYEMLVGSVVIAWTFIERLIDLLVLIDLKTGGEAAGRELPLSIHGKMSNLRKAARTNAKFAPHARDLRVVLRTVRERKNDRNLLAHGVVEHFVTQAPGGVEIHRLATRFGKGRLETVTLSNSDLDAMVPTANGIALALVEVLRQVEPSLGAIGGGLLSSERHGQSA